MRMMKSKTKLWALSAGFLGGFCFGGRDWLMMFSAVAFIQENTKEEKNNVYQ